jgi:CubicO group peptidase (beta-lactamase class C family)
VLSAFAAPRASPSRALAGTDHCTCSGPCPDYGKWTCRYANGTIDEKYKYGDKADCKAACHSSGLSLASAEDRAESLRRTLQPILEEQAARWNLSISYAFYDGATTVELAAGIQDHARQVRAKTSDLYPLGSATKPWTAAAIMQLAERGVLALDDPIGQHVDKILRREANASLREWFGRDLDHVTIRHLLAMRSGLPDYPDKALEFYTVHHPNGDIDPYQMIKTVRGRGLLFQPDQGGAYSSVGYELLGLVLAQHANPDQPSWLSYDQSSVLPLSLRAKSTALFPLRGPCSKYADKGMVHQYAPKIEKGSFQSYAVTGFRDFFSDSCLNGWTCGNIAARPLDIASFFFHLLHKGPENTAPIVSKESLAAMLDFKPFTGEFAKGLEYGLGLMALGGRENPYSMIGHAGEDWGSSAPTAIYDEEHHYGIAAAVNSPFGMTCQDGDFRPNFGATYCIGCQLQVGTKRAIGVDVDVKSACAQICGERVNSEPVEFAARRLFRAPLQNRPPFDKKIPCDF